MGQPYQVTRRVEFSDTDAAGIAHFTSFFRFMEQAEHALLRSIGESVVVFEQPPTDNVYPGPDAARISWPRVSATCDYRAPIRFEETFTIDVSVTQLGSKSVTYGFDFGRGETAIATGQLVTVCCRVIHGSPPQSIVIPDRFRLPLQQFQVPGGES